jgi:hypothetical protein
LRLSLPEFFAVPEHLTLSEHLPVHEQVPFEPESDALALSPRVRGSAA